MKSLRQRYRICPTQMSAGRVHGALRRASARWWPIAVALLFASSQPAWAELKGRAIVISGDTLEINGERIRLEGIMAPVDGQTCKMYGLTYDCRRISATALMDLTAGSTVRCPEYRVEPNVGKVGTCYAGGYDLSEGMVYTGWALAYPRAANGYLHFEKRARHSHHGLWRGAFMIPWKWPTEDRSE